MTTSGNRSHPNPYASPRHEASRAARTARRWKYHCPHCDAACLNFWAIGCYRADRLPRFPCPACGTVLQLHFDQKPGNRAIVLVLLGLAGLYLLARAVWSWSPRFVLWFFDRVDLAIVLSAAAAAIVGVLWALLWAGFHAFSVRKLSDDAPAAAQPMAGVDERSAS